MKNNKLIKNTIIISLGNLLPRVLSFITLPIITTYISLSIYGEYDLIVSSSSFIIPLLTLMIDQAAFRLLLEEKNEKTKSQIITTATFYVLIIAVMTTVFVVLFYNQFDGLYKILIVCYFIFLMFSNLFIQISRGLKKIKVYALSSILNSIVNFSLIILLVRFLNKEFSGLLIAVISGILFANIILLIIGKIYKYLNIYNINLNTFKSMIRYSLPIIPNSLSWWVLNLSDRWIIRIFLGAQYNAIYAISYRIPMLVNLAYANFNLAWQETAVDIKNDKGDYQSMFNSLIVFLSSSMFLLLPISPFVFNLLVNSQYSESYKYMPLLFLAIYINSFSSFIGGIFIAFKKTKIIGLSSIMAAIINLTINFLLINYIGLYAAVISTVISFTILFVFRFWQINKIISLKILNYRNTIMVILVILFIFSSFLNHLLINILSLLIGAILFLLYNKIWIIKILKSIFIKSASKTGEK